MSKWRWADPRANGYLANIRSYCNILATRRQTIGRNFHRAIGELYWLTRNLFWMVQALIVGWVRNTLRKT